MAVTVSVTVTMTVPVTVTAICVPGTSTLPFSLVQLHRPVST